jgi:hypothetical protein
MPEETCPQCGGAVQVEIFDCYLELTCQISALCYSEHRRRKNAAFLYGAEFHIEQKPEQMTLGGAA